MARAADLSPNDAVIVEAVRTPIGRRNGALADVQAPDLGGLAIRAAIDRAGLDPTVVEDVVFGCVLQMGEQALNVGRNAVLSAGLPESVPAVTIDRQCGSSQQALHFAAQGVMSGTQDVVVAGGVETMTRVPMFSNIASCGEPYGEGFRRRYGVTDHVIQQGASAEVMARKWDLSRADLDELALRSHELAVQARSEGRFEREIVPVETDGGLVTADEGPREDTSMEALAGLRPVFEEDGVVTAGNSSQISDGASALVVTSAAAAKRFGLRPRARVRAMALAATDPVLMLAGPIPATEKVLAKAGLGIDDIDLFEVNEAFAPVVGAWLIETGGARDRVNVNGGAIALGHPLGGSGARLMTTLLCELERSGGQYGLQTMCEGGGTSNATIIEIVD